jgi:hypothetical protein
MMSRIASISGSRQKKKNKSCSATFFCFVVTSLTKDHHHKYASRVQPEFSMLAFAMAMASNFLFAARGTLGKMLMSGGGGKQDA